MPGFDYKQFAKESYRILAMHSHAYFFTRFDCYPYHFECLKAAGFSIKNCLVIEKGNLGGIGDLKGSFFQQCGMDHLLPERAAAIQRHYVVGKPQKGRHTLSKGADSQQEIQDPFSGLLVWAGVPKIHL